MKNTTNLDLGGMIKANIYMKRNLKFKRHPTPPKSDIRNEKGAINTDKAITKH